MNVKISAKNQITLPVKLLRQLGINSGDILELELVENRLVLQPAVEKVKAYAGMLRDSAPAKYYDKSAVEILKEARKTYLLDSNDE